MGQSTLLDELSIQNNAVIYQKSVFLLKCKFNMICFAFFGNFYADKTVLKAQKRAHGEIISSDIFWVQNAIHRPSSAAAKIDWNDFFPFCENEVQPVAFLLFCPHCYGMDKDSFTKSLCVLNVKSLLINSKLYKKINFKKIRVFTLFIAPVTR